MIERLKILLLEEFSKEAKKLLLYKRAGKSLKKRQSELEPDALKGDSRSRAELGVLLRSKSGNKKAQQTSKYKLLTKLHSEGKRDIHGNKIKK